MAHKHPNIQEDIDHAIDALEEEFRHPKKKIPATTLHHSRAPRSRIFMLWSAVGLITLFIVGFWGWNIRTVFYDLGTGARAADTPLSNIGTQFDEALAIVNANIDETIPADLTGIQQDDTAKQEEHEQTESSELIKNIEILLTKIEDATSAEDTEQTNTEINTEL